MTDGPEARLVETARSGNRRALAELVERCEPLVGHLVGYGLAGHRDPGGAAREVMQRARRDAHQIQDPAGVRAWIAVQALWQVRHLRQSGHLGGPVDGLGLSGETLRIAEAARRLTPQDRDTLALWWLCAAGVLTEAEAGRVLGVGDAAHHGRRMLARLDSARTVLAALTAAPACPALKAVAAGPDQLEFLAQSQHVEGCPTCARHGGTLRPATPVLAAAGPVRLPGAARTAASPAVLPPPRRPPALMALPASAEVTAMLTPVTESPEVTARLPAPATTAAATTAAVTTAPFTTPPFTTTAVTTAAFTTAAVTTAAFTTAAVTTAPFTTTAVTTAALTRLPETPVPARRRKAADRRAWQLGLAALAVLAAGLIVVNLPGNPVLGPLADPSPTGGAAQALAPAGTSAAAADTGVPVTVLPADPPPGQVIAPPGGSAGPTAPGSGPATRPPATTTTPPATTTPPVAQPATLFSDDFESGSAAGWSKSGGTWNVVSDGSRVLRQTNPTPGMSRVFNGDTAWTGYSLRARVKPLSFGSPGMAGVAARATGPATYYRLALTSDGRAVLQAYAGSTSVTTLGSASLNVTTGAWYTLRLDVSGTTVTGYVDGQKVGSGTGTLSGSGQIGLQTNLATAEFDDVTVIAEG